VKAIVALAAYGRLASMLGIDEAAARYQAISRDYAKKWIEMARDTDHFRLAFDRPGSWSQKYNLVWDRILALICFRRRWPERRSLTTDQAEQVRPSAR